MDLISLNALICVEKITYHSHIRILNSFALALCLFGFSSKNVNGANLQKPWSIAGINRDVSHDSLHKNKRPNIILFMSDDHAQKAISAYNDDLIYTPNIDRIAEEGAIFKESFVTNSLCSPSRAVMLTGKHSFINGHVNNSENFDWDQDNFAKKLQSAGYQTAMIGKIHMEGLPQGFDYTAVLPGQGDYYNPDFIINGERKHIKGYVTDIITDLALDWLEKRNTDKPFLLLVLHKAPHREWLPEEKYYKEFTKKTFKLPQTLFDNYVGRGAAAKEAEMNILLHQHWSGDSKIKPEVMEGLGIEETSGWGIGAYRGNMRRMDSTQKASWDAIYDPINQEFKENYLSMNKRELMLWRYQRYMQDYLATIASVDDGVGEILDYLDAKGLEENSVVAYTSDQGFYLGEHGWFDKRFMYEQSLRTPLLIKYPKEIKPGIAIEEMVQNIDYAPTFLDYARVPVPENIQGKSLRGLLKGEHPAWRDAIYYTFYTYPAVHMVKRHYGVRTHRYKLIHFYYDIDEWELYDLKKDPLEMQNVYNDPAYVKVRKKMHDKLEAIREKYGDTDVLNQKFLPNDK